MSSPVISENVFLLYSFGMGVFITLVYDIFRIFRRVCPHKQFVSSLEDILFWIFCALSVFYLMHTQSNGTLRWFAVLGALVGMILYKRTLSNLFVKWIALGLTKVLGVCRKFLHICFTPFRFCKKKMQKAGVKVKTSGRRCGLHLKKKLTAFAKLLKITLCKQ